MLSLGEAIVSEAVIVIVSGSYWRVGERVFGARQIIQNGWRCVSMGSQWEPMAGTSDRCGMSDVAFRTAPTNWWAFLFSDSFIAKGNKLGFVSAVFERCHNKGIASLRARDRDGWIKKKEMESSPEVADRALCRRGTASAGFRRQDSSRDNQGRDRASGQTRLD